MITPMFGTLARQAMASSPAFPRMRGRESTLGEAR